ncbi:MAG: hypothetical protein OEY14_09785 [Myxococcales bacterium]|nr:hypothetical protein [Myxococcales bacterium]
MSCLVIDTIEPPLEENFPPSIANDPSAWDAIPPTPLDSIIKVDLSELERQAISELKLYVQVRDPNLHQDLNFQLFLDYPEALEWIADGPPIAATGELTRHVELTVDLTRLSPPGRCHKLELLVSAAFDSRSRIREPLEPGDLAQAVWWVEVTDDTNPTVDISTCP